MKDKTKFWENALEKAITIFFIVASGILVTLVVAFIIAFCGMVVDHKCQQLPISEFYSNKMCKPYWEVKK